MNLEKYFHPLSPCSPPIIQSSDTSTDAVVTNSSIESETLFVNYLLLNDAMGQEFVIDHEGKDIPSTSSILQWC